MYRHVVFLRHMTFFSILDITHKLIKLNLIHFDNFFDHTDISSPQVPLTTNFDSFISSIASFPLNYSRKICNVGFGHLGISQINTYDTLPSFIVAHASFEIVDLSHYLRCTLNLFIYQILFTLLIPLLSLLTSIHYLSQPLSYKEVILDHF